MCAITIEDAVKKIDGVKKVAVDITALIANVSFNADKTTINEIERAISRVGYQANMIVAVNEVYKNLVQPLNQNVWIGANDLKLENSFKYTDGSNFSYTNWVAGEPNNIGNEDFAQFYSHGNGTMHL